MIEPGLPDPSPPDLNLLDAACRRIAAQAWSRLPMQLHPGDLFALLPPGPLREAGRAHTERLLRMLERHGLRVNPQDDRYVLDALLSRSNASPVEEATFRFWCLHQRLQKQSAPQEAFRSLNTHVWDLAWDAGGNTAALLLSQILLCWTPEEIRDSLMARQPVYHTDEIPGYMAWLMRYGVREDASQVSNDVVTLALSINLAIDQTVSTPYPVAPREPTFTNRAPDRWRAGLKARNDGCLEALVMIDELDQRGIPLPLPLDWDRQKERSAMQQLRALTGLGQVAGQMGSVLQHARLQAMRRQRGLAPVNSTLHMVFTGNPGTGKTTVARLVARALLEHGILQGGQVIEVSRSDLVGEYLGQTAPKVVSALDRAGGGVLLIDEAHGLITDGRDPFGHEALDALVKGMEDRRDRLAVILCGYPDQMDVMLDANPGLRSRLSQIIRFPDYGVSQLMEILEAMCRQHDYRLTPAARPLAAGLLQQKVATGEAARGNARLVRNLFEEAVQRQAARLSRTMGRLTDEDISTLNGDDLGDAPGTGVMSA